MHPETELPTIDLLHAFLAKHYKRDRFEGRNGATWGSDYTVGVTHTHMEALGRQGFSVISYHESASGDVIYFDQRLIPCKSIHMLLPQPAVRARDEAIDAVLYFAEGNANASNNHPYVTKLLTGVQEIRALQAEVAKLREENERLRTGSTKATFPTGSGIPAGSGESGVQASSSHREEILRIDLPSGADLAQLMPHYFVEVFTHSAVHRGHITAVRNGQVTIGGGVVSTVLISDVQFVRVTTPALALESIRWIGDGDVLVPGANGPVLGLLKEVSESDSKLLVRFTGRDGEEREEWFSSVYVDSPQYG